MALLTGMNPLPIYMAVPVYVAEEVAVGRCLLQNFIHEEFEEEGVPDEILAQVPEEILEEEDIPNPNAEDPHYVDENFANAMQHAGFDVHRVAIQVGAEIREIANDFAKSQERKRIKKVADEVDLASISYNGFFAICEEVFRQGFTRENIVALFYFCADVVIKCAKQGMREIGIRLFTWALQFIVDRVCTWVARHGGWENAIRNTFSKRQIVVFSAATVGIVAVGGFIWYKWIT